MKLVKSVVIALIFSLFFVQVKAQSSPPKPERKGVRTIVGTAPTPTPKPVPKLVGESDEKSWKEYADEELGFKVLTIGTQGRKESKQEIDLGTVESVTLSWRTQVAEYSVITLEYPYLPVDLEYVKLNLNKVRDDLINRGLKLTSEKEISIEGYAGKEFIFEKDKVRIKTRFFYVGNKRYQTIFAASSEDLTSKYFLEFYETTANKFLNSFRLTDSALTKATAQIAEAKSPNPFDTEDFKGRVENSIYMNDYLGFSLRLPEKWSIVSDDEVALAQQKGVETFTKGNDISKKIDEGYKKNVRALIVIVKDTATQEEYAKFQTSIERLPYKSMKTSVYASMATKYLIQGFKNIETVGEIKFVNIGGKEFAVADINLKTDDKVIKAKIYMIVYKGVGLGLIFNYVNEKDLQTLENILKSFSFK